MVDIVNPVSCDSTLILRKGGTRIGIEPINVLLIEDDPVDFDLLQETLAEVKNCSFNINHCVRLSSGLEQLDDSEQDIVILDLNLPDSSGLETLDKIHMHTPKVPIVVLTGTNDESTAIKAVQTGAQDYIVKGMFDGESLARSIRYALERNRIEETLQHNNQLLGIINEMLTLSFGQHSLNIILDKLLDRIVSIPWLTFQSTGAIFLAENNLEELTLKASKNLPEEIKNACKKIPFGQCICGKAALTQKVQFVNAIDESHKNQYDKIFPHGHYCIPVLSKNRILGVIALYVKEGHLHSREEENFLVTIANTLAGIIERKKAEEALKAWQKEIEQINTDLENRIKKELEESRQKDLIMMHQSRLASMGEMVGLIAHQWRQPLNALNLILYNIQDLFENYELPPEMLRELTDKGIYLINKMSTTIDDFRDFFKPHKPTEGFSLEKTIKNTLSMLDASFKHNSIAVSLNYKEDISIAGIPNEYSHVLLNILNNAKDAIVSRKVTGKIIIEILRKKDYAVVKIADNGGGVPDNMINQVFNPYFTSKQNGKGTGLGLYLSKLIIEEHMGGSINVRNIKNGAEFKISTPIKGKKK